MVAKKDESNFPSRINTPVVTVRLASDLVETVRTDANSRGISLSEAIRQLVEQAYAANH